MYNPDTELLFPMRVAPSLSTLRGGQWAGLIKDVCRADAEPVSQVAFVLMMVRINGCITCNADSFRAMRGCTQCARQSIKRFRGEDSGLLEQYQTALQEAHTYFSKNNSLPGNNGGGKNIKQDK